MWDGYRDFCCNKCAQNNKEIQNKKIKTSLKHFNTEHPMKSETVKNKLKEINLDKFGVENVFQADEIKEKIKQTNLDRFGVEWVPQNKEIRQKQIDTLYKNFNVSIPCKSEIIKQKVKNTCQEKYNVDCILQLDWVREKTYETAYTKDARQKAAKTMRIKGNHSKLEDYLETLLLTYNIKYETEYKDKRYPYFCDFYLPELDIFIEIHGYWTHNDHLFDKNNKEDIHTLKMREEKANNGSKQYKVAINIWSQVDIEKYNCAKNNNLNYIILWNKNDIDEYISTLIQ